MIDNTYDFGDRDKDKDDDLDRAQASDSVSDEDNVIDGYVMVGWRQADKQEDAPFDGRDLRIIEKELYERGYAKKAPKVHGDDIKVEAES